MKIKPYEEELELADDVYWEWHCGACDHVVFEGQKTCDCCHCEIDWSD